MASIHDEILIIEGEKLTKTRKRPENILRGILWFSHALHITGLTAHAFSNRYSRTRDSSSGLVYKWAKGSSVPTRHTVEKIEAQLPGSIDPFNLPLFELLEDKPLDLHVIKRLLKPYRAGNSWGFPDDAERRKIGRYVYIADEKDSPALMSRGDIYGFTAIVGLLRMAEAERDLQDQLYFCGYMYRALPAVARLPWVYPHRERLFECVNAIFNRFLVCRACLGVDWDVINRQIEADVHETIREKRPKDPKTVRFQDLEEPIFTTDAKFFAKIVIG